MRRSLFSALFRAAALLLAVALVSALGTGLQAQQGDDEFAQFQQQQQQDFQQFSDAFTREYEAFVEADRLAFEQFKEQIEQQWGDYIGSTPKDWVEYGDDLTSRSRVDFEAGQAEVEVIVEGDAEEAREKLTEAVAELIGDQGSSSDYSVTLPDGTVEEPQPLDQQPVLAGQVETTDGTPVTPATAAAFAEALVQGAEESGEESNEEGEESGEESSEESSQGSGEESGKDTAAQNQVVVEKITGQDGKERVKATAVFALVPDHLRERAERYLPQVRAQAERFGLEVPLVFAVIHTESYFNPKARSGAPAYGLMQLVPTSGGRDAYRYVYDKDEVLPPNYLYQPDQNIELGCAYLKVLRTRYFAKVTDDRKALYCSVAGYNTGAGNVSKAFTGNTALRKAIPRIEAMETEQVYHHLRAELPYEETRSYLKKVIERMDLYEEWR